MQQQEYITRYGAITDKPYQLLTPVNFLTNKTFTDALEQGQLTTFLVEMATKQLLIRLCTGFIISSAQNINNDEHLGQRIYFIGIDPNTNMIFFHRTGAAGESSADSLAMMRGNYSSVEFENDLRELLAINADLVLNYFHDF